MNAVSKRTFICCLLIYLSCLTSSNNEYFSISGTPFGHAPGKVDETAKQVIFPAITQSTADSDAIYKKSHGTLAVAEQRSRGYDWDKHNIKPDTYVFGSKPQNIAFNGVSKSIADVLTTTEDDRGPVAIQRSVCFQGIVCVAADS